MEKRWLLFLILTLLVLQIFTRLMRAPQHPSGAEKQAESTQAAPATPSGATGKIEEAPPPSAIQEKPKEKEAARVVTPLEEELRKAKDITVRTKVYDVTFSTFGAKAKSWKITDKRFTGYGDASATGTVEIIPQEDGLAEGREFPLEIGLKEYNGKDFSVFNSVNYSVARVENPQSDLIMLAFTSPEIEGIQIVKTFAFEPESYLVSASVKVCNLTGVKYRFNEGGAGLRLSWGAGIGSLEPARKSDRAYTMSLYLTDMGVKSVSPKAERSVDFLGNIKWGGLEDKFFLACIIPLGDEGVEARSSVKARNMTELYKTEKSLLPPLSFDLFRKEFTLDAGQDKEFAYKLFVGPKEYNTLKEAGYALTKVMFHTSWSWMRALCIGLLKALKFFYGLVGNYGVAIILVTLLVRVLTHPLTHKGMKLQAKTMAEQQKLKPFIEEINKKYKGNPQMRNKEIMKLYKEHNINPLGMMRGCFPMLLQLPIFFALYRLLMQSIELRGAPFLWIKDLSGPDALVKLHFSMPFLGPNINLLPILMGISQLLVSKFSTAAVKDATQRQMMIMMPIFMTVILYNLPAGLVLYWLLSNIWQTVHQLLANEIIQSELRETDKKKK
jgi:YidC/Oxa1 family membrane protein insertase